MSKSGSAFAQHPASPITLWAPWTTGQTWSNNGGNFYGQDDHSGRAFFCIDWNYGAHTKGQPIRAAADGTVYAQNVWDGTFTGLQNYGNYVVMSHAGDAYQTLYGHLQTFDSSLLGKIVSHGTQIGLADDTGHSFGSHLHFCLYQGTVQAGTSVAPDPIDGQTPTDNGPISSHNASAFGDLHGVVKSLAGQVVSGASVTLTAGDATFYATTDSNGVYQFASLPIATVSIVAAYQGVSGSTTATVHAFQSSPAPVIWLAQCTPGNSLLALSSSCGPAPTPIPQPTPQPTGWNETFFSDNSLSSTCGSQVNETDVYMFRDSDTGWQPPSGCPNSDNAWSVRMQNNSVPFQGGNYEFGLFYDDAARVYIDNQLSIDGWTATQHYEGHYVSPGNHQVTLEYKNNAGHAIVALWWRGPGALPANTQTQDPNQWWVNYWGNQSQWQDAVGSENEGTGFLNHDWGDGGPGFGIPSDHFSLKFERFVYFDCGIYRFHLTSDDGSRLWIDGVLLPQFDHWVTNVWDTTVDRLIPTGGHALHVDYFENGGSAHVSFDWTFQSQCADANKDGKVDGVDYVIWLNHYNQATSNGAADGDFNLDGHVDGIDYIYWLNNYHLVPSAK